MGGSITCPPNSNNAPPPSSSSSLPRSLPSFGRSQKRAQPPQQTRGKQHFGGSSSSTEVPKPLVPQPPAATMPLPAPAAQAQPAAAPTPHGKSFMGKLRAPPASSAAAPVPPTGTVARPPCGTRPKAKGMETVPLSTLPLDYADPQGESDGQSSPPTSGPASKVATPDDPRPTTASLQSRLTTFTTGTAATDDPITKKEAGEQPLRKMRREVSESNYRYRKRWKIPTTVALAYKDLESARPEALPAGGTRVSFSSKSTSDALLYFAKEPAGRVCALNFANGTRVGGGYKTGAMAQEEDLCRRIPNLYSTLYQARRDRMYPFGPSTCATSSHPAKYSDVLFTPNLVLARLGEEDKYQFLPAAQQAKVAIITAAAPNINFASEVYDLDLMYNTVRAILIGPKHSDPGITTLVLGAWGCGAFGGDPKDISNLFALALKDEILGRLYREIHFAIPDMDPSNQNAAVFKRTLREHGILFSDL